MAQVCINHGGGCASLEALVAAVLGAALALLCAGAGSAGREKDAWRSGDPEGAMSNVLGSCRGTGWL